MKIRFITTKTSRYTNEENSTPLVKNYSSGQASHHGEERAANFAVGDDRISAASKNISDSDKNVVHKIGATRKFFYLRVISGNDMLEQSERIWIRRKNYRSRSEFKLKTTYFTNVLH